MGDKSITEPEYYCAQIIHICCTFQIKQQWQGGWPCDGPHCNPRLKRTDMAQFWDTDHLTPSAALSLASSRPICAANHIGQTHRENFKHWFSLHFNMADCQRLHCRLQAVDMKLPQSIKRRMKNSILCNMIIKGRYEENYSKNKKDIQMNLVQRLF